MRLLLLIAIASSACTSTNKGAEPSRPSNAERIHRSVDEKLHAAKKHRKAESTTLAENIARAQEAFDLRLQEKANVLGDQAFAKAVAITIERACGAEGLPMRDGDDMSIDWVRGSDGRLLLVEKTDGVHPGVKTTELELSAASPQNGEVFVLRGEAEGDKAVTFSLRPDGHFVLTIEGRRVFVDAEGKPLMAAQRTWESTVASNVETAAEARAGREHLRALVLEGLQGNVVVIKEGAPFLVPPDRNLVVTGVLPTGSGGPAILRVNGSSVPAAGFVRSSGEAYVRALAEGLYVCNPGDIVEVTEGASLSDDARAWGYLTDL